MISLGSAVRRLREEAGLTQRELAQRADITASYLSRIETDRRDPTLAVVRRLSRELSVWPGLLLATIVQIEMPDDLRPIFNEFVEQVARTVDADQLTLPFGEEATSGLSSG